MRRSLPRPGFFAVVLGSAICLLVLAATSWMVWEQRVRSIEKAGINLRNLSVAVADQTDRVIASLELAESHLLEHIARRQTGAATDPSAFLASEQFHTTMSDVIAATPEAYDFLLADENGKLLNSSRHWPALVVNVADRAYFRFALAHPEIESFVSEALVSRQSGKPVFNIVRRLSGPGGAFKGVLLGSIQVDYLERLFGGSTLPKGGSVRLLQPDGSLLAGYPSVPFDAVRGKDAKPRASFSVTGGIFQTPSFGDGAEQLTAVSRLPRHSLVVEVSEPLVSILVEWRIEAVWTGTIAMFGCIAIIITILLAVRRFHDQHRLEAADQQAIFGMALDNMNEALLMFDQSNRLLLANAAVKKIFELPPGSLCPGMPVVDVIAAVAHVGNISAKLEAVTNFYMQLLERNVASKFIRRLPDGRHLAGNFAPHAAGWIVTYEDMTEVRKADERIAHMALHDALTGLPNRTMLRTRTEEALEAIRDGGSFAIICLDLDHFKDVNDTLGHSAGDKLLCEVAGRIRSAIQPTDIVARLGGDEFAVVLYGAGTRAAVAAAATRLAEGIGAPFELSGQAVFVGASLGIAIAPADGSDPDTLMKNADLALYRAKNEGRGHFAFFEPAMQQDAIERQRIGRELHHALSAGQLDLYYQPIVRVDSRRVIGFEALMRWNHPTRGMVSPTEFIPVAEANGFIVQLGRWALNKACLDASQWPDDLRLAVNLSPVQFRSGAVVQAVTTALEASGLAPHRLECEITESTMMIDTDATLATLNELKALGVRIAMDDFGTGYSALAYLQKFPFDKIKIDRSFIRDIGHATNLAIVRAVTGIAESLGISTTAEGVETEDQFAAVARAQCTEVQGYLFSQPRPANEVAAMLARANFAPDAGIGRVPVSRSVHAALTAQIS